jgi:DNA ligase-associated metallophosphoesterase
MHQFNWQGHSFGLSPQRFIFWEKEKTIIISDLHLGKTGHFRKEGIAMPQQVYKEDLQRLFSILQQYKPSRLLIVGDMVHSKQNKELDWFCRWRNDFAQIDFTLIKGNHDILKDEWYHDNCINTLTEMQIDGLRFVHDDTKRENIVTEEENEIVVDNQLLPTISGHIHPGILMRGIAKQSLQLPCFFFNQKQCFLPAFSHFTGSYILKPQKGDDVFVMMKNEIYKLPESKK